MRNRKQIAAVLTVAVILGIVGCKNQSNTKIGKDDIEITTTTTVETTTHQGETSITTESETTVETVPEETVMPESSESEMSSETTNPTESSMDLVPETTTVREPSPTTEPIAPATPTSVPTATPVPTDTPKPTESPVPTATPTPSNTPVPTNTPSPEPTPFDIDKSAKENGYEIIDIDMGDGKTERIYGYYVDMSELSSRINDYRESIGLSRLPTDTNHVSEMKTRAAEATVKFSHWRPNGHGGSEVNLSGGVDVNKCYEGLYNSDGHRAWWEDTEVFSIYCVGFKRMQYNQESGKWVGHGGATVVFMDF